MMTTAQCIFIKTFDKDKLVFKAKDTRTSPMGRRWQKNIFNRTVALLQNPKTKTYADFIHKRVDCIQPDQNGEYGTKESIALSIAAAQYAIAAIKEIIRKDGRFVVPAWKLETRDRSVKTKKLSKATLKRIEKFKKLGLVPLASSTS